MKIFIDVDNTILEHSHFYSKNTESRTHKVIAQNINSNKEAIKSMYQSSITSVNESFINIWNHPDVYILTKYPSIEFDKYKQEKLIQILGITHTELLNKKDENGISKYMNVPMAESKMDFIKELFNPQDVSDFVLIDDYSQNLIEWESQGGIGIKFFNEYNNPYHPTIGLTISNFKLLDIILNKNSIQKIYFQSKNALMLEMIINNLLSTDKMQKRLEGHKEENVVIDMADAIYKDSLNRLSIEGRGSHVKYNYLNFIKEYYGVIEEFEPTYWGEKFDKYCQKEELIILKSPLDIDVDNLFKVNNISSRNYLSISILTEDTKINYDYNLFITLNEKKNHIDNIMYKEKLQNIFKIIFKGIDE